MDVLGRRGELTRWCSHNKLFDLSHVALTAFDRGGGRLGQVLLAAAWAGGAGNRWVAAKVERAACTCYTQQAVQYVSTALMVSWALRG
jgi:hypothetical protein